MQKLGAVAFLVPAFLLGNSAVGAANDENRCNLDVFQDCPFCPKMVGLTPGEFSMGLVIGAKDDLPESRPQYRVTIEKHIAFSETEVTREEYGYFVDDTGHDGNGCTMFLDDGRKVHDELKSWKQPGIAQTDEHPVTCVSWLDAKAYAEWLSEKTGESYRLPTEAEWEYAARAGTETQYYWGNDVETDLANFKGLAVGTKKVASYEANKFRLHDMLGNVAEFVEDDWHINYQGAPNDGSAWLEQPRLKKRIWRGGSWTSSEKMLRPSFRYPIAPKTRTNRFGIRLARDCS